ncbi:MAG: hypothetical protein ACTS5I_13165, partial [Rhodanobacter sp.]
PPVGPVIVPPPAPAAEPLREFMASQKSPPHDVAKAVAENWHRYSDDAPAAEQPINSRSRQRRIAAETGEPAPRFDDQPEARWVEGMVLVPQLDDDEARAITLGLQSGPLAAAPEPVRVDEAMVVRALCALVHGTDLGDGRWNVASFIDSCEPPFTETSRDDVMRAALTAALAGKDGTHD